MLMLGLNDSTAQLTMTNSACWYAKAHGREDGEKAIEIEVECQRKNGMLKLIWKKQVEEERVEVDS